MAYLLQFDESPLETHADAAAAGAAARRRISGSGFAPFVLTLSNGHELEWTDPDLFLEEADILYFLQIEMPLEFVRPVFINWQFYAFALKPHTRN